MFDRLEILQGEFWTRLNELIDDIESLGFIVTDSNKEYIIVNTADYEEECIVYLEGTESTFYIGKIRDTTL